MSEQWQPRFYAACALSVAVVTGAVHAISQGTWVDGFVVGYGAASALGLLFLAIQHWTLRGRVEVLAE